MQHKSENTVRFMCTKKGGEILPIWIQRLITTIFVEARNFLQKCISHLTCFIELIPIKNKRFQQDYMATLLMIISLYSCKGIHINF